MADLPTRPRPVVPVAVTALVCLLLLVAALAERGPGRAAPLPGVALGAGDVDQQADGTVADDSRADGQAAAALPAAAPDTAAVLGAVEAAAPHWGVELMSASVEDLRSGRRWAVHGDRWMSFMSSSKFPWAVMATATAGVEATGEAARATFAWSDNDAAAELIELAGGLDAVNGVWYPALGMGNTCHQQWYGAWYSGECGADVGPPFDGHGVEFHNHSTAADLTTFLGRLWRGEVPGLDDAGRAAVLEWSLLSADDLDFNGDGTLTGYLPPGVRDRVHHKVGWDFDRYLSASDVGIVDAPGATYAIALAAFGGTDAVAQQHYLAWASCELYRGLAGDLGWSCPETPFDGAPGAEAVGASAEVPPPVTPPEAGHPAGGDGVPTDEAGSGSDAGSGVEAGPPPGTVPAQLEAAPPSTPSSGPDVEALFAAEAST